MRQALLDWYDAHKRALPWRETKDPYAIWVSEIMLQQTRVETVIPYWTRFLDRFPTTEALAEASEDEVLSMWSGLGYYRRARLLHAGVKEVVARYGGAVPEGADERLGLPGVGRYTAGAIGSIAFDRPEPIVDGNVARVLSRVHGVDTPLGRRDTEKRLWAEAEALADGPRPGDLNQALMELGARVCTPTSPRCDDCPISRCVARDTGKQSSLPVPRPKKAPKRVALCAVVARRGDRVALTKRAGALFGGLHGVPTAEGETRAEARAALKEAEVSARLGKEPVARLEHVLTHRRLDVRVWRATGARSVAARLFSVEELSQVGISSLTRKILDAAR